MLAVAYVLAATVPMADEPGEPTTNSVSTTSSATTRVVKFLDADGDGALSPEEFRRFPAPMRAWLNSETIATDENVSVADFSPTLTRMLADLRRKPFRESEKRQTSTTPSVAGTASPAGLKLIDGDTDRDGMIGYYEWKTWKGTGYEEFAKLDRNSDGFLEPTEFVPFEDSPRIARRLRETKPTATTGSVPVVVAAERKVDLTSAAGREARYYFNGIDRNPKDEVISEEEWKVDRNVRPWFEQNKVKFGRSMDLETFAGHYIRLSGK